MSRSLPLTLGGVKLRGDTGNAENSMGIGAVRFESQDRHDRDMYAEAAKRVVFQNCMEACNIEHQSMTNFNSKFYYTMHIERNCLGTCFNTKMDMHFGKRLAI